MNKMECKLRKRAARLRGSQFNTSVQLRYMANDFPGTVFLSEDGQLRYVAKRDPENFANAGKISGARIGPYQPNDTGNYDYLVEIRFYERTEFADKAGKLETTKKTDVVESPLKAREWINEHGLPLGELPTETIEEYKHPNGADPITVDMGNGEIITCYVIDETEDRLTLAKPHEPQSPQYDLEVGSNPVELVWLNDEEKRKEVRKFFRKSH